MAFVASPVSFDNCQVSFARLNFLVVAFLNVSVCAFLNLHHQLVAKRNLKKICYANCIVLCNR